MVDSRDRNIKTIINYCSECGIEIHTSTKARGHQGVFLHNNKNLKRIDIRKNIPQERFFPVIAHEFAHYFHQTLDKDFESLQEIFGVKEEILLPELESITAFVAGNETETKANTELNRILNEIKKHEEIIKKEYPEFKRSQKFKEFEKYIKHSDAKYLLRYDKVKMMKLTGIVIYNIETIEKDFPEIPQAFIAYIHLKRLQRYQRKLSRQVGKLKKYYAKPTELFARFIEGLVIDREQVKTLAPEAFSAFIERLEYRKFKQLKGLLDLIYTSSSTSSTALETAIPPEITGELST